MSSIGKSYSFAFDKSFKFWALQSHELGKSLKPLAIGQCVRTPRLFSITSGLEPITKHN